MAKIFQKNLSCKAGILIFSLILLFFSSVFSVAFAGAANPNLVVLLKGLGTPVVIDDPRVEGDCFETILYDVSTNLPIGTGADCLVVSDADSAGNILIDRTTVFDFPSGRLITHGATTVVPIFGNSSPAYTHVVGDVDEATQNIIGGTHNFANKTGDVRLSGIVNLADLPDSILFNCIFIIDFD
jgi:hypothetical protein